MITVTDKASIKVREFIAEDEENKGKSLRVYVEGGGCAGFQYNLIFDNKNDNDEIIKADGFDILIDPMSAMYLRGVNIDYIDGLMGSGFKINNPNATGHCGCNKSFSA